MKTILVLRSVLLAAITAVLVSGASAQESPKVLILPGERLSVNGRPGFIFMPPAEKRSTPQPWVMYAPTLEGFPDGHEKWMHQQFLDAGIAVAGLDVGEAYGSPRGRAGLSDLYAELTGKRGSPRGPFCSVAAGAASGSRAGPLKILTRWQASPASTPYSIFEPTPAWPRPPQLSTYPKPS